MTNKLTKLEAQVREVTGRKVKVLRRQGLVPANIFGKDIKSVAISIDAKEFRNIFKKVGETGIIEITFGKETRPVIVSGMQTHPVTDEILHVDLRQVDLKAKIRANVPVEMVGESPAEKQGLGIAVQQIDEVEVEALPLDLPEKFEVDATVLETLEDSIKVSDLKVVGEVEILAEQDQIIANVSEIRKEEERVVAEEAAEDPSASSGQEGQSEEKSDAPATEGEDSGSKE